MKAALQSWLTWLAPAAVVAAAALALPRAGALPVDLAPLRTHAPFLLLPAVLALAWRFRQGRLFFFAAMLLALVWAQGRPTLPGVPAGWAPLVLSVTPPLTVALLFVLGERGLFTLRGGARALLIALPAAAAHVAAPRWPDLRARLTDRWLLPADLTPLPELAVWAFALAALIVVARFVRTRAPECGGALAALVATALALHDPPGTDLLTAASLCLGVAVAQASYHMVWLDQLTGLPGRRAFDAQLAQVGRRYSVAMVDVDFFKKFNDKYGHDVGDEVLRMVARRLARVGGGGRPFRYGGEEFAVVFPGKRSEAVLDTLERLRASIAETPFSVRQAARPKKKAAGKKGRGRGAGTKKVTVTASLGVADRTGDRRTPEAVLKAADQALYKAKRGGRNQVQAAR